MKLADLIKSDTLKSYAPLFSAAVVAGCAIISLSGYEMPTYAATEDLQIETASEDEDAGSDEETAKGSFDLEDGVYQGTGVGYAGTITVAVEIKDQSIVSIEVLEVEADDEAFFNRATAVIDRIIEQQSLDVDTVSGATYSSRGIINAVKNALTGEEDTGDTGDTSASSTGLGSTTVSTVTEASAYQDGTYYGTGTGFAGPITVKVVISGGEIVSIDITETSDDSSYISRASALIKTIIATQSTNVDTVSGATYSSVGIIEAVRNALSKAAVSGSDTDAGTRSSSTAGTRSSTASGSASEGTVPYDDGIYYGTGEGYAGDITVAVVIQDHTIKAILVTESEDDEAFFNRAMTVVTNVIAQQNTNVDTVSGATYSSNGLLEAIRNALEEAAKATSGGSTGSGSNTGSGTSAGSGNTTTTEEDINTDTSDEEAENHGDGGEGDDSGYIDGKYTAVVLCEPDEYLDFDAYNLTLTITVENGKITEITDISGDGDSGNDRYINWAANGRGSYAGVVEQILAAGTVPDEIDAVSRATCSSNAIAEACREALKLAEKTTEEGEES